MGPNGWPTPSPTKIDARYSKALFHGQRMLFGGAKVAAQRRFFDGDAPSCERRRMVFFVATVIGLLLADDVIRFANRRLR